MGQMESRNPATEELLATYETLSDAEIDARLDLAVRGASHQRQTPISERAEMMARAADVLEQKRNYFAEMLTAEMGKPIVAARAEVDKCALVCRYYAENGPRFMADRDQPSDAARSFVRPLPIGPVLAVMPWNFPFWQVLRFAAPALMAGNGCVLKHASNVVGCALAIEELLQEAGLPEHLFRTLVIGSDQVAAVIENPTVRAVTLTGSTPAGQAVASKAGSVLKKTVLELGGSDPYIVLEDADLEETAATCAASRLINSGQSCIAAKRFVVVEPVRERFEQLIVERMRAETLGDPLDEEVTVGPQAREDLRDELHQQVTDSVAAGACCLLGGEIPDRRGAFYPPTVLTAVEPGMPAYDEELFGPVAAIIAAEDEDDAVRIANDSCFGLGAAVFSGDSARGERIAADRIEAGSCFVNAFVKSDPRLPFGGIKESGYGRELSKYGIREFVNIKTVYVS